MFFYEKGYVKSLHERLRFCSLQVEVLNTLFGLTHYEEHLKNELLPLCNIAALRISVTLMSGCNQGDYGQWHSQHVYVNVLSHPLPQFYIMQISCSFRAWLKYMLAVPSSIGELCETSCSMRSGHTIGLIGINIKSKQRMFMLMCCYILTTVL